MRLFVLAPMILAVALPLSARAQPAADAGPDSGGPAARTRLELGFLGGAIVPLGGDAGVAGGSGMLDLRVSWPVGRVVHLGIRAGLGIGGMEWDCSEADGLDVCLPGRHRSAEPGTWGGRGVTLTPQVGFLAAFDTSRWFTLEVTTGFGMVAPVADFGHDLGLFQYVPVFSGGLAGLVHLYRSGATEVGLAIRIDYVGWPLWDIHGFLLPQVGVNVRF